MMKTTNRQPALNEAKKTIAVAIGIVVRDQKLLIAQRRADAVLGCYWEFPGGKIEPGESAMQAVVREIMEELGIRVTIEESLPAFTHTYAHGTVCVEPFLCSLIEGTPKPIGCTAFQWVTAEQMPDFTFPPANESLLALLRVHPVLQTKA